MFKKSYIILSVLVLALTATAAFAQYSGSWDFSWDFSNDAQGWALGGNTGAAWSPQGTLYLPGNNTAGDGSVARKDVASLGLGTGNGFVFQADVFIPNLSPQTFSFGDSSWSYPSNVIQNAGISAFDPSGRALYFEGIMGEGTMQYRDQTGENVLRTPKDWSLEPFSGSPNSWWNCWLTLQIDYNYTTPGKWSAYLYKPYVSWDSNTWEPLPAGWVQYANNVTIGQNVTFNTLQLGGAYSWTQAQFDNVKLEVKVVPEPSSLLALGSGLLAAAGMIRRRK